MEKIIIGLAVSGFFAFGAYYLYVRNKKKHEPNFQIKKYDVLKFSDIIKLSKELTKESGIPESSELVLIKMNGDYVITFYDKVKNMIIQDKTIKIQCNSIDESLRLAFGDKDMLVIEE